MSEYSKAIGYTYRRDGQENSIRRRLANVCNTLDGLVMHAARLQALVDKLEAQGISQARPYWMRKDDPDGKPDQLELTHSTNSDYYRQHGTRREYIGVDAEKIKDALGRVQRFKEHRRHKNELRQVNDKIQRIERQITRLELVSQGKQLGMFWDS